MLEFQSLLWTESFGREYLLDVGLVLMRDLTHSKMVSGETYSLSPVTSFFTAILSSLVPPAPPPVRLLVLIFLHRLR